MKYPSLWAKDPASLEMLVDSGDNVPRCRDIFMSDIDEEHAERKQIANAKQKARTKAGRKEEAEEDLELENLKSRFSTWLRLCIASTQKINLLPQSLPFLLDLSVVSLNPRTQVDSELLHLRNSFFTFMRSIFTTAPSLAQFRATPVSEL